MFRLIEKFHDHDDGHHSHRTIACFDSEAEAKATKQNFDDNNQAEDCVSFHIDFPEDHSGLSDLERHQENWCG